MNLKETLHCKLKGINHPMKLMYPFEEEIKTFIYTSKEDEFGYCSWRFKEKEEFHQMNKLVNLINQNLHEDLLEYANSFWFLSLEGRYSEKSSILTPVIPTKKNFYFEEKIIFFYGNIQKQLNESEIPNDLKRGLLRIGLLEDYLEIYFSNLTGEIFSYDFDSNKLELIEENLSSFIEKMQL